MATHAVSGRLRLRPRVVNDVSVSPRPCSRIRMLIALPVDGGTICREREEGKSDGVGRRGIVDWFFVVGVDMS